MSSYPIQCPHCPQVVDSMDSLADSRADLRDHLALRHPDMPDPLHDPTFVIPSGGAV